jgi:hypothetical protein
VGYEIEQRGFGPLAVELREGGEHAASEFHSRKHLARGRCNVLDRRLLWTLRAPGCHDLRSEALETTTASISRRALRRRGDFLKRRSHVGLVRNDHLEDDLRRGGFATCPIVSNSERAALSRRSA